MSFMYTHLNGSYLRFLIIETKNALQILSHFKTIIQFQNILSSNFLINFFIAIYFLQFIVGKKNQISFFSYHTQVTPVTYPWQWPITARAANGWQTVPSVSLQIIIITDKVPNGVPWSWQALPVPVPMRDNLSSIIGQSEWCRTMQVMCQAKRLPSVGRMAMQQLMPNLGWHCTRIEGSEWVRVDGWMVEWCDAMW